MKKGEEKPATRYINHELVKDVEDFLYFLIDNKKTSQRKVFDQTGIKISRLLTENDDQFLSPIDKLSEHFGFSNLGHFFYSMYLYKAHKNCFPNNEQQTTNNQN